MWTVPVRDRHRTQRWRAYLVLAALALIALAVRLYGLGTLPLFVDEPITLLNMPKSWSALIEDRLQNAHSPLYFLFLKAIGIGMDSVYSARLLSALFDTLATFVFAALGYRLGRIPASVTFGLLYAATPILLDFGQIARPYAPLHLFTVIFLFAAVHFALYPRLLGAVRPGRLPARVRRFRKIIFAMVVVGSAGAAAVMMGGLITWIALDLAVIAVLMHRRRLTALRKYLLLRAIAVLAWLPFAIAVFSAVHRRAGRYWVPEADLDRWFSFIREILLLEGSGTGGLGLPAAWKVALGTAVVIAAILGVLALLRTRKLPALVVIGSLAAVPLLGIALISLHTSIVITRYGTTATIGFIGIAAFGIAALWAYAQWGRIAAAAVVLLVAVNAADFALAQRRLDYAPASKFMTDRTNGPLILGSPRLQALIVSAYYIRRPASFVRPAPLPAVLGRGVGVWLYDFRDGADFQELQARIKVPVWSERYPFGRFSLYRIEPANAPTPTR